MSPTWRWETSPGGPVLLRPVAPMLAAPVESVPQGPNLIYEPKWDGWRALAFRGAPGVYLQSRAGRNLTPYFPDITRALRAFVPPGVVLDGELVVWERGRTNFPLLQRRVTAGRQMLREAREHPAYYVTFDPTWTAAGVEGVVIKRLDSRYETGRRGWAKFRARATTEAIIGGVTGSIRNPETALLGRFDRRGRLRYTGRTHPLATQQRQELASLLSPPRPTERHHVIHPWPEPLPAAWSGRFERPEPPRYAQVEPTVVAEIQVDTAYEHHRWRHRVRYARPRPDLSVYDVPLILGEGEDPFSDCARTA